MITMITSIKHYYEHKIIMSWVLTVKTKINDRYLLDVRVTSVPCDSLSNLSVYAKGINPILVCVKLISWKKKITVTTIRNEDDVECRNTNLNEGLHFTLHSFHGFKCTNQIGLLPVYWSLQLCWQSTTVLMQRTWVWIPLKFRKLFCS